MFRKKPYSLLLKADMVNIIYVAYSDHSITPATVSRLHHSDMINIGAQSYNITNADPTSTSIYVTCVFRLKMTRWSIETWRGNFSGQFSENVRIKGPPRSQKYNIYRQISSITFIYLEETIFRK